MARSLLKPEPYTCLPWNIQASDVQAEKLRQGVEKVDLKFCLNWHFHACESETQLWQDLQRDREKFDVEFSKDKESISALAHFILLEQLDLVAADDGGQTIFGSVLKSSPKHL